MAKMRRQLRRGFYMIQVDAGGVLDRCKWLEFIRRTDKEFKGGRITEVVQMLPGEVVEGRVYDTCTGKDMGFPGWGSWQK